MWRNCGKMMNKDLTEWACWTAKGINVNGKDYCQGHIIITDANPVRPLDKCYHCTRWIGNRRAIINGNMVSDQSGKQMDNG